MTCRSEQHIRQRIVRPAAQRGNVGGVVNQIEQDGIKRLDR
jgi:hypothetical protein